MFRAPWEPLIVIVRRRFHPEGPIQDRWHKKPAEALSAVVISRPLQGYKYIYIHTVNLDSAPTVTRERESEAR